MHPIIAIVGRPNVGKSRLFNRLTGHFSAIVDDTAGVTRDRHYALADWRGREFLVVDTGGLIPGAEEPLTQKIWGQAFAAIREADLILCVLDAQSGPTAMDEALIADLRRANKPVLYCLNKVDARTHETAAPEFSRLGLHSLYEVSAEHGRGVGELLDGIYEKLPPSKNPPEEKNAALRVAVLGRPNAGKSTLINRLFGEDRVLVHEEAGTTRDAIDVQVERGEKSYCFVDTAGFRRKKQTKTRLEKMSVVTALKAMERSDIVLYLLDALEGLTHHDLYLLQLIWEAKKGLLLVVNKWDRMRIKPETYLRELRLQLRERESLPILSLSAKSGWQCEGVWEVIDAVEEGLGTKMTTARLNDWLCSVGDRHPIPSYHDREVRLFYATQVGTHPPHILIFSNEPRGIPAGYRRFLQRQFEETTGIAGVPVQWTFRKKT